MVSRSTFQQRIQLGGVRALWSVAGARLSRYLYVIPRPPDRRRTFDRCLICRGFRHHLQVYISLVLVTAAVGYAFAPRIATNAAKLINEVRIRDLPSQSASL